MSTKKGFITEKLFHQLSKPAIKWKDLLENHIYKVKNIDRNAKIASLVSSNGDMTSVCVPDNVIKKLALLENNLTVYIKRYGVDVQIATKRRLECLNCGKNYASRHTLLIHKKNHCNVMKKIPEKECWYQ
tara:strand:+ start:192 stop:581 length:390 start_codon:yes stop_codon:yes gene_type:complete